MSLTCGGAVERGGSDPLPRHNHGSRGSSRIEQLPMALGCVSVLHCCRIRVSKTQTYPASYAFFITAQ
ncbi:unnamed protein product [Brassica rapa subsp. trilocularis]